LNCCCIVLCRGDRVCATRTTPCTPCKCASRILLFVFWPHAYETLIISLNHTTAATTKGRRARQQKPPTCGLNTPRITRASIIETIVDRMVTILKILVIERRQWNGCSQREVGRLSRGNFQKKPPAPVVNNKSTKVKRARRTNSKVSTCCACLWL
jgi:hypothetical protein